MLEVLGAKGDQRGLSVTPLGVRRLFSSVLGASHEMQACNNVAGMEMRGVSSKIAACELNRVSSVSLSHLIIP